MDNFQIFIDVLTPVPNFDQQLDQKLQELSELYPNDIVDASAFKNEYFVFCATVSEQKNPPIKSITEAASFCYKEFSELGLFPSVWKLFKLFRTASPSVCASERSFSRLKLIKTYLRNKMKQERLHYLMLIGSESDLAKQVDLDKLSEKWATIKSRRIFI